jgi:hypothetical protein
MEDTFFQNKNGSATEKESGVQFSESVIIREKTRKILHDNTKKKGINTVKKGREEAGKGCIPLLIKLEEGNNNFHSKMGKEYSNLKKRREEDKKVRE